jgi:hypothetical protein
MILLYSVFYRSDTAQGCICKRTFRDIGQALDFRDACPGKYLFLADVRNKLLTWDESYDRSRYQQDIEKAISSESI